MKKPKTDEYNIEGNIPSQEVTKIRRVNQSLAEYQKFISIENTEY